MNKQTTLIMNVTTVSRVPGAKLITLILAIIGVFGLRPIDAAAQPQLSIFEGGKTTWHEGFDRYDFIMDEETLAISPFKAPADEKFGVKDPEKGKRRCIVVVPKKAAP